MRRHSEKKNNRGKNRSRKKRGRPRSRETRREKSNGRKKSSKSCWRRRLLERNKSVKLPSRKSAKGRPDSSRSKNYLCRKNKSSRD